MELPQQQSSKLTPSTVPDVHLTHCTLSPEQQQDLLALLHEYIDMFATTDEPLRHTTVVQHAIHTKGPPIHQPMSRQPVALQAAIDSEV